MSAAYLEFEKGARDLRAFVLGLQLEKQLLAATSSDPPCSDSDRIAALIRGNSGTGSNKRRFDYNTVVISLYGLFEQLVEGLIGEYALILRSACATYSDLPEKFRSAHSDLSIELLSRLEYSRYRGRVSLDRVIENLHRCLSGDRTFSLNVEALQHHSANYRGETLNQSLARLGVESLVSRLSQYESFSAHLAKLFPDEAIERLPTERLFATLDKLAEWRNDVAHGVVSELQSNEILLDTLAFLEALGHSLSALIHDDGTAFRANTCGVKLGQPLAVFDSKIVCFEFKDQAVRLGDVLVAVGTAYPNSCLSGEILELQVEKIGLTEISAAPSVKVGCRVGFRAKQSYEYVLLVSERVS